MKKKFRGPVTGDQVAPVKRQASSIINQYHGLMIDRRDTLGNASCRHTQDLFSRGAIVRLLTRFQCSYAEITFKNTINFGYDMDKGQSDTKDTFPGFISENRCKIIRLYGKTAWSQVYCIEIYIES